MHLIEHTHTPGNHCSSTAISDLLRFHGVNWSEAFCFGLGGGLGITYLCSPSRILHTRSLGYEERFFKAIGVHDFKWRSSTVDSICEEYLISVIKKNRPALILTDIYHLHYFNTKTHFPGHGIVVWGCDEQKQCFYVTDTERENIEVVSFSSMRKARKSSAPPFIYNGNLFSPKVITAPNNLDVTCWRAIVENALRLIDSKEKANGIFSLTQCKDDLVRWSFDENWKWECRFAYQTIEKRGTGGAGFRKMYASFLGEAAQYLPSIKTLKLQDKMIESAEKWFELSQAFKHASEQDTPDFTQVKFCIDTVIAKESEYCEKALLL